MSGSGAASRIVETRSEQMFPILEPLEIERMRRFGVTRAFGAGDAVVRVGEAGHGLGIILASAPSALLRHPMTPLAVS